MRFLIEAIGDLPVRETLGEMPDAIHNRDRTPHAVSNTGRQPRANVTTGAALPPDVNQMLSRIGRFLDCNILDEQP